MGWTVRKSFSSGPFRLNVSKSGFGVSTGVKGLRVSAGRRGMFLSTGAKGLYYRQKISGSSSRKSSGERKTCFSAVTAHSAPAQSVFYDERQIDSRTMEVVNLDKINPARHLAAVFTAGLAAVFVSRVYLRSGLYYGIGICVSVLLLVYAGILGWVWLRIENSYRRLAKQCFKERDGGFSFDAACAHTLLSVMKLNNAELHLVFARLFLDFISGALGDKDLSESEINSIRFFEEALAKLGMSEISITALKRFGFHDPYIRIIGDSLVTEEEEKAVRGIKDALALTDEDVPEEMHTLNALCQARRISEGELTPVSTQTPFDNETCYHSTEGRIVKEKNVYSYQEQGVRHQVRDYVIEKEGVVYLTGKRLCMVAAGVFSVPLNKIVDIDTDLDRNLIRLRVDGRTSLLDITVPDSRVFSAKLNRLVYGK